MAQDSTTAVPDEGQLCWLVGGDRITEADRLEHVRCAMPRATEAEVAARRATFTAQVLDHALRYWA